MNVPVTGDPGNAPSNPAGQTSGPTAPTSVAAIVSLVAGIACWVLLPIVAAIVAIVAGHIARAEIRRNPQITGDGLALAGLLLGYGQLMVGVLTIAFVIVFFGGIAVLAALFG